MSQRITAIQEKMDFLRQKPHVFDIIVTHGGVKNLTNITSLDGTALNRLQRYVDYYYGIVTG